MNWRELNILQYTAPTRDERTKAREKLDAERVRLYNEDRKNGSHLLYNWTREIMEGFDMAEIENDIPIPTSTPVDETKPKAKRGRKPGSSNKPPENSALMAAVSFIDVVQTEVFENSQYCAFRSNSIVAYSNVLAVGHPVAEELTLCPQIDRLKAALSKCGRSLAVTESNGKLSVKGDKLRALVPCLVEPLADIVPDMPVVNGDFDGLKMAFQAACTVADEKAERAMFASVLLDPNTVTATNGMVLLQYWHGYANLPPATVVPKLFAQAIAGIKYKITGIGATWDNEKGHATSLTIWFENGAWLKTQCYEDRWQNFEHLLNVQTAPVPVYEGLFEAVEAIQPFIDEEKSHAVHFVAGAVRSHPIEVEAGAHYEVKDLPEGKIFNAKLIRQVSPFVKTIDLTSGTDKAYFFGGSDVNPIRGVFMGMSGSR